MSEQKYKYLNVSIENSLATVKMNRPPDNSLNIEMMHELSKVHNQLEESNHIKAILLTSEINGYFSNGLDLEDLLNSDSGGKIEIFEALYEMAKTIYSGSKLHAAYLNGHAMAGGAVLAAMSDFRFFLNGPYRIGFSEAKIGLGIPAVFLKIIESIVGSRELKNTTLLAKACKPEEALQTGLVDDLFDEENALPKIQKFITRTLLIPAQSYGAIKYSMREENIRLFNTEKQNTLKWFHTFFNDTLTEGLLAIREKRRPRFP